MSRVGVVGVGVMGAPIARNILKGDFTPGFMVRLGHKDLRLALDMARAFGVRTPVGSAAFDTYGEACRLGLEREDVTSILRLREGEAGVRVRLSGR